MKWLVAAALLATVAMGIASGDEAQDVLLEESFAGGAIPAGWDARAGKWSVVDGRLRGEATEYLSKILLPVPAQENVAIEADVAFERAADIGRWVALAVRNPDGAPSPHLQLTHRFDRTRPNGIEIGWLTAHQPGARWSVLATASAPVPPKTGETHRLRFEVRGWQARGFLDGKPAIVQILPREAVLPGRLALVVSSVTATFDNVRVWKLPPIGEAEADRMLSEVCAGPLVIAHRGNSAHAPENTLASIREAIELGVEMVEVDVTLTKDGVVVLMHDGSVDRTTNGKGKVSDLTLAELKALDAGAKRDAKYAGERIPTLEEALRLAQGKVTLVLDLKGGRFTPQTAEVIDRLGASGDVIAGCWTFEQSGAVHKALPLVTCKHIIGSGSAAAMLEPGFFASNVAAGMRGFSVSSQIVTPAFVRAAHRRAMPVYVWTVNDPGMMERLVQMGVDGIYTDDPATLQGVIEKVRRRAWLAR